MNREEFAMGVCVAAIAVAYWLALALPPQSIAPICAVPSVPSTCGGVR